MWLILKRWLIIVFLAIFALYGAIVIYRVFVIAAEEKTKEAVERIHGQRLTMGDVRGDNLPSAPDSSVVDATVAGVDANENGIRDDVELAIFEKYSDSARTRAPMLQYARALQMEFTDVFNSETLVAVTQEEGRGYSCVYGNEDFIYELIFNTDERKRFQEEILRKYMVSYSLLNVKGCDIDQATLPN